MNGLFSTRRPTRLDLSRGLAPFFAVDSSYTLSIPLPPYRSGFSLNLFVTYRPPCLVAMTRGYVDAS